MKKRIAVCGSYVTDLMARAPHLPVAGETVLGNFFQAGPGGKGFNQAVAAHKAGGDVTIATKLGNDVFAALARETMEKLRLSTQYVFSDEAAQTGAALISVNEQTGQNEIVVVPGACYRFSECDVAALKPLIQSSDLLLLQLEINLNAVREMIKIAQECGTEVILNPAPVQQLPDDLLSGISIITPNEVEAYSLTGIRVDCESSARAAAQWFFQRGVKRVVITLGDRGVYVHDGQIGRLLPARDVHAVDTTGAGDAFNGGLVTALAEGKSIWDACEFAIALASLSVQRLGTTPSMPYREETDSILAN